MFNKEVAKDISNQITKYKDELCDKELGQPKTVRVNNPKGKKIIFHPYYMIVTDEPGVQKVFRSED